MPRKRNGTRSFEREGDWEEAVRILKVMAHPVRLLILDALARKSLCVRDLNTLIPIPQPHLSQHMAALRKAELVESHKDGTLRCYYLLRPELVRKAVELLKEDHPIRRRDRATVQREARGESPD